MIELYLLEQFVKVSESSSLQEAAKKLYVSQPTLTRSMQKLERQLGVSLFERRKNKLELNETGKVAAKYAKKVLEADRAFVDQVILFDRSQKMIQIGSCSPYPIQALLSYVQSCFPQKTVLSELGKEESLLSGLNNRKYQLIILEKPVENPDYTCLKLGEENLYIALPKDKKLTDQEKVSFDDLKDLSVLVYDNIGIWKEICQKHFRPEKLLLQQSMKALNEIAEASNLPFFITDRTMELYGPVSGRTVLPIEDKDAHLDYWLLCLSQEQEKYRSLFYKLRTESTECYQERILEGLRNLA